MRDLNVMEIDQIGGGSWEMDLAEGGAGVVVGAALGFVGAPVLVGVAAGAILVGAFTGINHLLQR